MACSAFLELDGIEGDCSAKNFEKMVECGSWSWGAHNSMSMDTGGRRTQGNAEVSPVRIGKALDSASMELAKRALGGNPISKGTLSITARYGDESMVYYKIEMSDCYIGDYTIDGHGEESGDAMESLSIYFSKVKCTFTKRDPKTGDKQGDVMGEFDTSTGELA